MLAMKQPQFVPHGRIGFPKMELPDTPLSKRQNDDKKKGYAKDRHTRTDGFTIRTIVKRKASGFTVAEVAEESAKLGIKLKQVEIKKGLSTKYALVFDENVKSPETEARIKLFSKFGPMTEPILHGRKPTEMHTKS